MSHERIMPLYFKVPCRVQLFGIVQDARIEQCNYLFGGQHTIGPDRKKAHGSNSVVSMLHHHLDTNAADKSLHFHADNCTGQNKNKTVLGYLAWRCVTGLSEQIELSFMRVGHTLSAMDCYFGLIKKRWHSTENYTMENAVEKSSNANRSCHILLEMAAVGCLSASIFKPVKNILKFLLSVWPAPTPRPSSVEKHPTVSLSFFKYFGMMSRLRLTVMTYLLSFIRLVCRRPARRISKRRWNTTLSKMPKSICRGNN